MAAASTRTRARLTALTQPPVPAPSPPPAPRQTSQPSRRSPAMWVLVGLPVLLLVAFAWQIGSSLASKTDLAVREAVAVGRVSLESDPAGTRIDFVVVDRVGQEVALNGTLGVKLREPDGTLWQTSRTVSASDFQALPDGGLLAGRTGYSVVVPASDWARAPRRGGTATVSVNVQPSGDSAPFSTVAEERFP